MSNDNGRARGGHPYASRSLTARLIQAKGNRAEGDSEYGMEGLESTDPSLSDIRFKGAGPLSKLPYREKKRDPKPAYAIKPDNE